MRTVQSERFARNLFQILLKDFEKAAHPRDEGGRFAPTEARRVAEAMLPGPSGGKPLKHPQKAVQGNSKAMLAASAKDIFQYRESVAKERYLGGGEGEVWKVEFKDGSKAVYKPTKGSVIQTKLLNYGLGDEDTTIDTSIKESDREIAAFQLSQAAGFDIVPPVEKVTYFPMDRSEGAKKHYTSPGGGHAMAWVDGEEADKDDARFTADIAAGHPDLHRIAALDFITGILDRHEGNFMHGNDGRYYAVDSGLAFCRDSETGMYNSAPHRELANKKIPDEVQEEIRSIKSETLTKIMKDAGFKDPDIQGATTRLGILKATTRWKTDVQMLAAAEDAYFQSGGRRRAGYIK